MKLIKAILPSRLGLALLLLPLLRAWAADAPIAHQVVLPAEQSWCSDSMINGLAAEINSFRVSHGVTALNVTTLGMKDAELRASQFATYMLTTPPGTPGFFPHQGYDTTAASLGYPLISENLAYITTDPAYIVEGVWQDSLHLAALLAADAKVMGVSCVYDAGTAYWTYEPGSCSGTSCGTAPAPSPSPTPSPSPSATTAIDSEEWAFLTLINSYRAQNGLGPLQVSVDLEAAAKWMSADMAANNYFSHTDSAGRSTGARLPAFGYTFSPWGENLAAGYATAQDAFNGWQTACDPDASGACTYAHRKNMLTPGFTAIGIARAYGSSSSYGWYWTTDFGGYVEQAIPAPGTTPTPTPTPTPTAPSITSLTATPAVVAAGFPATLSWVVTGATSVSIDNGVGDVSTVTSKVVSPAQTTTYTLTARNSAGTAAMKVTVTVTVAPPPATDTQAPSAPVITSALAKSSTEVDLAWNASADNVAVTGYQILRNGAILTIVPASIRQYSDLSVSGGTAYAYTARAFDAAGNVSAPSNLIQVTTPALPVPTGSCSVPAVDAFTGCYYSNATLSGTPSLIRTDGQINFDWGGNTPDRLVSRGSFSVRWQGQFSFASALYTFTAVTSDGMRLYLDGALVLDQWSNQGASQYSVQRQLSQGTHLIAVEYSEYTGWSTAHLTWQASAPTVQVPAVLSFASSPAVITAGQAAKLTWSVNGATSIRIDSGVGDVTGSTAATVKPAQTTTYTLTATNAAGSATGKVTVTVTTAADTLPPTPPALLSAAAATGNQVTIAWSASADNVGVAGYQVVRNGSALGSVSGATLSFIDSTVAPATTYTYSARAFDGAGNYSTASNAITVTTAAAPPTDGSCPAGTLAAFTGCYYANATLTGVPAFVRTDPQINFDWGGNPPDRVLGRNGFSARWKGSFQFAAGTYTFTALVSDGGRLYIDGKLVLDQWVDEEATQYAVQQSLSGGTHSIVFEYYEKTGWSSAHLSWRQN